MGGMEAINFSEIGTEKGKNISLEIITGRHELLEILPATHERHRKL